MTTKTQFKWFWLWEDEKEEQWLRSMALDGWHLKSIGALNRYSFDSGVPQDVAYRLDFQTNRKDLQNYLQLFHDAGWEHVGQYGSWQYFRKPVESGEVPEIFTDNESKMKKYQRILALLVVFLAIWWNPSLNRIDPSDTFGWISLVVFGLRFTLFVALLVSVLMLARRVTQLRKTM